MHEELVHQLPSRARVAQLISAVANLAILTFTGDLALQRGDTGFELRQLKGKLLDIRIYLIEALAQLCREKEAKESTSS